MNPVTHQLTRVTAAPQLPQMIVPPRRPATDTIPRATTTKQMRGAVGRFLRNSARRLTLSALVGVSVPRSSSAQSHAGKYMYVVKAVGDWVVVPQVMGASLAPLTHVALSARIGLRSTQRIDPSAMLVLRDPISLRIATLRCKPISLCRVPRHVDQLTFATAAPPISAHSRALFARIGDGMESRASVRQVGARGRAVDWGMMTLAVDSGVVGVDDLIARLGNDRTGLTLRLCALSASSGRDNDPCQNTTQTRAADCELDRSTPCPYALDATSPAIALSAISPTAVSITILARRGANGASQPMATAVGVVSGRGEYDAIAAEVAHYWRDLRAVRDHLSDEELRALSAAASLDVARARSP